MLALIVGDILFIVTANGVDETHINIPAPEAPSFIALDKKSKSLWKSNIPGSNIMHGQWSNPVFGEIDGVKQVISGGDGWLYSFTPEKGELIWKFDCNPKNAVYGSVEPASPTTSSARRSYTITESLSESVRTPEHTTGIAAFYCIAPTKKGDISKFLAEKTKDADGKEKIGEKQNPNSCEV